MNSALNGIGLVAEQGGEQEGKGAKLMLFLPSLYLNNHSDHARRTAYHWRNFCKIY